nr:hypothetical protein [Planctomycetota bacterium]
MNLEVLSASESVSLCLGAAKLVLNRFRGLAQRTRSGDRPLSLLFDELAGDVERNLIELKQVEGPGRQPEGLEEEKAQKSARGFLPSLSKPDGGGPLDREAGFYLAESILEDLAGFYGTLVRQTCDDKSREHLLQSKKAVEARIEYLHRVVL